jgi:D-erythrulose 1-phosphate 3-epimerase
MSYRLGVDLGFARNRYHEPEVWTKVTREELGLGYVSMVADIFNPSWPKEYREKLIERTKKSIDKYDIKIDACFTSAQTRVSHFTNTDKEMRAYYMDWFKEFFFMMGQFGCKIGGSNFGIYTYLGYDDESQRKFLLDEAVKSWQELSFFVKELGFEYLTFEPMSIPREMAITVSECKELMDMVNSNCGVPMKICLDVGHAPHPDERDPYFWMEQLGADSPIVHLQQTVLHKSMHAPFTKEFNEGGIIDAKRTIDTLKKAGLKDALFALELSHREHFDTEFKVIEETKESVDYWRPFISE